MINDNIVVNIDPEIQFFIDSYADWFRKELTIKKIGQYKTLVTPFLDRNNDNIQVYIETKGDEVIISDDGWVINNLEMSQLSITPKRKEEINRIKIQNGVLQNGNELHVKTNKRNYPQVVHRFIQSLLEIDDMYLTAQNRVNSLFYEDVKEFLLENDIFYSDNIQIIGKSSFSYRYDFLFQKNKNHPERLCKLVNNPTKAYVSQLIFMWEDTKITRSEESTFVVIINDNNKVPNQSLEALDRYNIKALLWNDLPNKQALLR